MIKNYMELVVDHLLPTVLEKYPNICTCDQCMEDIKAMALNHLKPMYVVTQKGNIYAKLNELEAQFKADTLKAITQAVEVVSKNPNHDI
ncbi:MAG: late competence development ComFB family protein [Xylanivirga thermophila]|jgi:competence protein ComFB|uniref:late competence development ComFB family protein n=1 Tax=Xylanivirga thermophila TaxID=2496273 RepID=UPI00101DCD23|nr:late competence development ComFB family protein [Xylanivirga thermophila]